MSVSDTQDDSSDTSSMKVSVDKPPRSLSVSDLNNDPTKGYSDVVLRQIGSMLNSSWRTLGVYLGIPYSHLTGMMKVKLPQEMALEMFHTWWRSTDAHNRWGELHYALAMSNRYDLVADSRAFFRSRNMDYNNPNQGDMELYFARVSDKASTEWEEIGSRLGVSHDRLKGIKQQPENDISMHGYKVLKMWQALPSSTHHGLFKVLLDDMRRNDVFRHLLDCFTVKGASLKRKHECDVECDH